MADVRVSLRTGFLGSLRFIIHSLGTIMDMLRKLTRWLFQRENLYALLICLLLLALLIFSVDQAPLWIYQGF